MTRMYFSPTASIFARIGLVIVECLIGLYNLITFPIRKITFKVYSMVILISGVLYAINVHFNMRTNLVLFIFALGLFTASIFVTKAIYNYLSKKVSPRVAMLINSPLGVPRNRFYNTAY